jgi:hypothetical protein
MRANGLDLQRFSPSVPDVIRPRQWENLGGTTMSDTYTEVTRKDWTTRIGESVKGIVIGLVLIVACCVGLFWNEGRAVQTAKSLAEGAGLVVSVGTERVDPANEGKLIHVSGTIKAGIKPNDAQFGVSAEGLRLVRTAEMYQWQEEKKTETRKNPGGSEETITTYSYVQGWSRSPVNSRDFKEPMGHSNPPMRFRGAEFDGGDVTLGAFHPGKHVVAQLSADQRVPVTAAMVDALRPRLIERVQEHDGMFYLGDNPTSPRVGDMRISYRLAPNGPVSIIGQQTGSDFTHYQTKAGDRLLIVREGTISAADMFKDAQTGNMIVTWVLRLLGALLIYAGFRMILSPLVVVADVVPLIGNILGAGASLVSLAATAVLAPLVIAIAWFWYRPLISVIVLAVGVAAAFGFKRLAARKVSAQQAAPATA